MKKLGKLLHITSQGLAVLKLATIPTIDASVSDTKGRLIGRIGDIFGPVSAPYALVRLMKGEASRLNAGSAELYLLERGQSVARGRHGRH